MAAFRSSITNEGYRSWWPDPALGQTAAPPQRHRPQPPSSLALLLVRVANKIEERTHNPWWMLQRSFFYKDKSGIRSPDELVTALAYFKVGLADGEIQLLFDSFQTPVGTFDFKAFAHALYPPDNEQYDIKDGRKVPRLVPASTLSLDSQHQPPPVPGVEPIEVIPLANPETAPFAPSSYVVGASDVKRVSGKRRIVPGGANGSDTNRSTSSRIFGTGGGAITSRSSRPSGPPVRVNDLHTMRPSAILSKAASNSLAGTKGAATGRKLEPIPRISFLNLSRYDNRYEKSQAAKEAKPFIHTAR